MYGVVVIYLQQRCQNPLSLMSHKKSQHVQTSVVLILRHDLWIMKEGAVHSLSHMPNTEGVKPSPRLKLWGIL